MTNKTVDARSRTTIASTMVLIAMIAAALTSIKSRNAAFNSSWSLFITLLMPLYIISNLQRPKSATELLAVALAVTYLAWGAFFVFWPGGLPSDWLLLDATHGVYRSLGHWLGQRPPPYPRMGIRTLRWHWGLLAALYAAILFVSLAHRVGVRPATCPSRSPATRSRQLSMRLRCIRSATLIMALWFFFSWLHGSCPVLDLPYGSCPFQAPWCGRLCLAGLAGSLLLAAIAMRPLPSLRRLTRSTAPVARLVPAATAGVVTGLVYSLWGWRASAQAAALCVVILVLFERFSIRRPSGLVLVHLLVMFWGFAISAKIGKYADFFMRTR